MKSLHPSELQALVLQVLKSVLTASDNLDNTESQQRVDQPGDVSAASEEEIGDADRAYMESDSPLITFHLTYDDNHSLPGKCLSLLTSGPKGRDKKNKNKVVITINLSLTICISRNEEEAWPLHSFCPTCHGIQPTPAAITRFPTVECCRLVAQGAYWRISFSGLETQIMTDVVTEDQKQCLRAIKVCVKYLY
jgi:hypothetical protein